MKIGSLFSGIGGIEIGFEQAGGYTTEWFVEYEPYAQSILRKQYPNATIYGDITKINWDEIPRIDILTGGFPCQDISNAGRRDGITGSRSSLWKHYLEAIRILRPRYAVIENVSALTIRGLDVVLGDLAEIGYDAEWYNISASSVGAFHRRERIFILAYPNSRGWNERDKSEYNNTRERQVCSDKSDNRSKVWSELGNGSNVSRVSDVSNSNSKRLQGREEARYIEACGEERKEQFTRQSWWAVEPELGRVAYGVPNRMDRIRCLGNAVVPQVAEVFARAIKEYEKDGDC